MSAGPPPLPLPHPLPHDSQQPSGLQPGPLAQRTVVEVVAKRSGFTSAVLFLVTLAFVGAAFVAGILFGVVAVLAPGGSAGLPLESELRLGNRGPGNTSERIAIIGVEGGIDERTSAEVERAVGHVLDDPSFKAVVLRVDSPGGAVSPSDRIWREIERLKAAGLPVVASYGGMAASGGVYVSCGADHIVCEPTATTGSVGVIASVLTFGDLMDKVGVQPETIVATGSPRKDDANDIYRSWDEGDKAVVQGLLDRSYATFVDRVMAGRGTKVGDPEVLRAALDGRVFGAEEAKAVGLVDTIGYLDDAIGVAEGLAGLAPASASVVRLFEPAPLFGGPLLSIEQLVGSLDPARRGGGGGGSSRAVPTASMQPPFVASSMSSRRRGSSIACISAGEAPASAGKSGGRPQRRCPLGRSEHHP
jgi:protease IV